MIKAVVSNYSQSCHISLWSYFGKWIHVVRRSPSLSTPEKSNFFSLLKRRRKAINNNVQLRKEHHIELFSCNVKWHLDYRQYCNQYYGIRKAKAQQKANINDFSNYTGSRRASARRKVQARQEGKHMPVSLTSVPQTVLSNQNRFTQCKSCLTKPIAFYNEVTDGEGKEGNLDVMYLAFSTISHSLLITKLVRCGLNKQIIG